MSLKQKTEELHILVKKNQELNDLGIKAGGLNADQNIEYENRDKEIDAKLIEIENLNKQDERSGKLKKLSEKLEESTPRQVKAQLAKLPADKVEEIANGNLKLSGKELTFKPGSIDHLRNQPEYSNKWRNYVLSGDANGLNNWESLGLVTGSNPKGGYLVPMTFLDKLIKFLDDNVYLRKIGTVIPGVSSAGIGVPSYDTDAGDADWTTEILGTDEAEDDNMAFGRREMVPQDLLKVIYASRRLINGNGSVMDIESFIAQRMGYKFAITEEKAGMTGAGQNGWLGIFTADANGITTAQDITCNAVSSFNADDVIETINDLKFQYQANASWIITRTWLKMARKLKTSGSGEYIWQMPLAGNPATIADRPYYCSEYAPTTFTTGKYIAVVGDFSFYWIADGLDMTIERDDSIRRLKKQVAFVGEKSSDGAPVLAEAFRRMKLA